MQKLTPLQQDKGIYFLKFGIRNPKVYIGSANNVQKRVTQHIRQMRNNNRREPRVLRELYNQYKEVYVGQFCDCSELSRVDMLTKEFGFIAQINPNNLLNTVTNLDEQLKREGLN